VWVVRIDGTAPRRVTRPLPGVTAYGVRSPGWSPDGGRLLYVYDGYRGVCESDYWTGSSLITVNADGTHPKVVARAGEESSIWAAEWSPDASRIAYLTCSFDERIPCKVWVVDGGGKHRRRLSGPIKMRVGPYVHWTRDSREVLVPAERVVGRCTSGFCGGMLAIDAATGHARPIVARAGSRGTAFLALSGNGRTIAFAWSAAHGVGRPALVGLDGRDRRPIPQPRSDVPGTPSPRWPGMAAVYLP